MQSRSGVCLLFISWTQQGFPACFNTLVSELIDDAYALICAFYKESETIYVACEELKELYNTREIEK